MLEKTFDRIFKAMVRGVQDVRDQMFAESQRIVNVDRGTLKKSGFTRNEADGGSFGYRTPYAARVNFGLPAGYSERVRRHWVRAHRRRMLHTRRYISVKRHERGPFKRTYSRGVKGSHYMERSIDKFRPQIGKIILRRIKMEMSG